MSKTAWEQVLTLALGRGLRRGSLTLVDRDGSSRRFEGAEPGPDAVVVLAEPLAARKAVTSGSLGLAEGYMAGAWDTPDLDAVLALGVANIDPEPSKATWASPFTKAWHALQDNDITGSRRNITYHYDLGNDFYRLWLDETMAYSSALDFTGEGDISAAQVRKWDRMLELLQPDSSDHLLEIGFGWGGFAVHAAKQAGCKVTGVTLSDEQHEWASDLVMREGLEGQVELRLQDYRHVAEQYSAIASIEMFEAVGEKWWSTFFSRIQELLAPGGRAALQTITIEEPRFEDYRRNPDFIQRYVFPGGMLPSPERFAQHANSAGLDVEDPLFFGGCYANTLAEWSQRFEAALPQVRELGFDERFVRMWRYYLSYCKAGFDAGTIDVMQVRLGAR